MAYIQPKNLTVNLIKKQVIRVEKLVGQKNKFKDVAFKKQRLFEERKRSEERERKVEYRSSGDEKAVSNKISTPKLGFLDVIKNFFLKVLLGAFAIKLLPQLPKLKGVLIGALKFSEFILEFAGSLLNTMVTFVDNVYKIVDFGKEQSKLLGGDKGLENYNKTIDLATKVMNSMFIAGMLFSDLVESDARGSAAQQAVETVRDRVVQQGAQRAAQQGALRVAGQVGARAAAGVVAGVGLISSALGEGMFQLRKFTTKIEQDAYAGLAEAQKDPNPFMRFLKVGFYNTIAIPGMRFYNFLSTGVGTLLDVIGAPFRYAIELINFGIMSLTGDAEGIKNQRENLGKFDARIREQLRQIVNTLSFGMLAKQQGSFGSLFGDQAVKSMGYASGGAVTRGGVYMDAVTRTVGKKVKAKRVVEVPTSPLQPGFDVGGIQPYKDTNVSKIQTFYPNPEDPGTVSSFKYLQRSYDVVSSAKFLHPILEIGIKALFGDKPPESDYKAIGFGLNNFFNNILDTTKVSGKDSVISDETGPIDISKWASTFARESMMSPINSILNDLMNQLTLKVNSSAGGEVSPSAQKGDTPQENPLSEFGGTAQFVIGDSIARGFAGLGSSPGTDLDDTKNGRSPESVLQVLKRKGDSLKGVLIDLSTGIANNVTDFTSVDSQLSYLKSIKARVRILGVGNTFSKENGGINEKLSQLASKYGFYFYGGYKGGADKVHATPKDYSELKAKMERDTSASPSTESSGVESGKVVDRPWNTGIPLVTLRTKSGLSYQVAKGLSSDFSRFVSELESTGYKIKSIGGWRKAGTGGGTGPADPDYDKDRYSHPYGGSIDINPGQNPYGSKLVTDLPSNISQIAAKYGLGWGGNWTSSKDAMHFSAMSREGGRGFDTTPDGRLWKGSRFNGGYIDSTGYFSTHPGEYVVDADSVELFGIKFYDIINQVETISQRKRASDNLISILSQYTEDGYPETEEDYTYYMPESSSVAFIPPVIIPVSNLSSDFGDSSEDPSQDDLFR